MKRKNQYYRGSHISEPKFRQLIRYFVLDLSATDVAQLTGLTRKTVNVIFLKIRQRIAQVWEQEAQDQSPLTTTSAWHIAHVEYARYLGRDGSKSQLSTEAHSGETQLEETESHDDAYHNNEDRRQPDEKFQEFIKRRLQKFKGLSSHTLDLHLKECGWRFSRRDQDLYAELLNLLRQHPL